MDQPKLERLLRLMKLLTANNSLTYAEVKVVDPDFGLSEEKYGEIRI